MKILIFTAEYGNGHLSVTKALRDEMENRGHEVIVRDPHMEFNKWVTKLIIYLYEKVGNNSFWKWLYHVAYHSSEFLGKYTPLKQYGKSTVNKIIDEVKPDIVFQTYCTHNKPSQTPIATFVTDYHVPNSWYGKNYDKYFVSTPHSKKILMKYGVPSEEIVISGIPVSPKFEQTKKEYKDFEWLKNYKGKKIVLLTLGAYGKASFEKMDTLLNEIEDDVFKIVVCGKNEKIKEKLDNTKYNNTKIFGYVNNMNELLSISDLIMTKAGGITMTESIMAETPMYLNRDMSIPGQEYGNIQYSIEEGVALTGNFSDLGRMINEAFKDDSRKINIIKENIKKQKVFNQYDIIEREIKQMIIDKSKENRLSK